MNAKQLTILVCFAISFGAASAATLEDSFKSPPDSARPGVYWYFMDGNLDREEMVKDLESMKEVGLGNLVFLEVDVGVPRGPVKFMSDQWQELFANAVRHAERLGIDITLGAGPGWTGSGGPWVKPEQSMQHLVFSTVETKGPGTFDGVLPVPEQRSTRWHKMRSPFYEDVVVCAFPKCNPVIGDINEKALYERNPYTSMPGVKPYLPAPANYPEPGESAVIDPGKMIDLTDRLQAGRPPDSGTSRPASGRSCAWGGVRPVPAPGPRPHPAWALITTSSTRPRWMIISRTTTASCSRRSGRVQRSTGGPPCTSTAGRWVRRTGRRSSVRNSRSAAATIRSPTS